MKYIKFVSIFFSIVLFSSCDQKSSSKSKKIDPSISKIEVIDFHSIRRCFTCNAIESNTKHTLNTHFANELKSGKIELNIINIDEKENYELAEKFKATGTSLFLNVILKGKEEQIDLTDFAFSRAKNKEKFTEELKTKIEKELKKL